jgi:hypothetical protein
MTHTPPERLNQRNIEDYLSAMRVLLYDAAGLSGDRERKDLRIAQVVGNLGDNYYMEDVEYINLIWGECD